MLPPAHQEVVRLLLEDIVKPETLLFYENIWALSYWLPVSGAKWCPF
jgi:hypothetical protein